MKCILRRLRCRGGGAARARRGGLLRGRGEPLSTQAQGENGSPGGKYRILSGIQPTGKVHLGNYVGAVRNWVGLQTPEHETFYSIVDLHALTSGVTSNENESVASSSLETAATMLACGIDPTRSTVFRQSRVPAHCELMWVLACHTPLGWLNRMTQFKQKSGNDKQAASLGLYSYPVLQAADILLYDADLVPVGEDQHQHIELARDIATSFNARAAGSSKVTQGDRGGCLVLPRAYATENGTGRVMGLRDGTSKMSKSSASDMDRINLSDDADTIAKKIRKAKTDATAGFADAHNKAVRPEMANLLGLYSMFANSLGPESAGGGEGGQEVPACQQQPLAEVAAELDARGVDKGAFKAELTEALVAHIIPIGNELRRLREDKEHLESILREGEGKAAEIAEATLQRVKAAVGLPVRL